jgi:hypothetical protein
MHGPPVGPHGLNPNFPQLLPVKVPFSSQELEDRISIAIIVALPSTTPAFTNTLPGVGGPQLTINTTQQ